MTLSSIPFIFGILPIFLLLFFFSKPQYRIYEILVFSAWFYYVNDQERLKFMIALIIANYVISLIISHTNIVVKRLMFVIGILGNTSVLFLYKYLSFSVSVVNQIWNLQIQTKERGMMIGLSFLTFSLISYLVDVYRNDITVPKNPIKFADYVLMFPKILMGPIVRYSDIADSLDNTTLQPDDIGTGSKRFMEGLFKKVIIADNLAILVSQVNGSTDFTSVSVASLWIGSIAYSLQLFFDFSGYSDMAIGLARMMGFRFKENFNYPYSCDSFTDFWRRWHISLSEWFRDYIYIPLGGSRKSMPRNIFNLLAVWLLTGIWHGAGYAFICWGLVYFLMLLLERYIVKPKRLNSFLGLLWRIITLLVVNFNWVLFSHEGLKDGIRYCLGMIGIYYHNPIFTSVDIRYFREYGLYIVIGILFSVPVVDWLRNKISNNRLTNVATVVVPICYVILLGWALSFIMLGFHNPFMSCIPALHNYAFAGSGITPKSLYNCSCFFRTSPTISAVPGAS